MNAPDVLAVARALRAIGVADSTVWAVLIVSSGLKHGIDTPERMAAFIGNICHESAKLTAKIEGLNYAADKLVGVFGAHRITRAQAQQLGRKPGEGPLSEARQQAIANIVYGGAWGLKNLGNTLANDGYFFRGKGPMQLTGRANHTRFAKACGIDVVALQALLATPAGGIESAAMFWSKAGCNEPADRQDHAETRRLVNGGHKGLAEVVTYSKIALAALSVP